MLIQPVPGVQKHNKNETRKNIESATRVTAQYHQLVTAFLLDNIAAKAAASICSVAEGQDNKMNDAVKVKRRGGETERNRSPQLEQHERNSTINRSSSLLQRIEKKSPKNSTTYFACLKKTLTWTRASVPHLPSKVPRLSSVCYPLTAERWDMAESNSLTVMRGSSRL